MSRTIAIIPAREGSKGVKNKNIKPLLGHPLLAYSIAAAKLANVDEVIISTDSQKYADIALEYGAKVPFIRPVDISNDNSSDYDFMKHAMKFYNDKNSYIPELWLHLRPTTPLRDPKILKDAIKMFENYPNATSLRSAHEAPESPFKWFLKDANGYFKGLKNDLTPEKVNMPRQTFPKMYIPDGYIDIVKFSFVIDNDNIHGDRMLVFETPRCTEVDTIEDFNFIEYYLSKRSSTILKWLDEKAS